MIKSPMCLTFQNISCKFIVLYRGILPGWRTYVMKWQSLQKPLLLIFSGSHSAYPLFWIRLSSYAQTWVFGAIMFWWNSKEKRAINLCCLSARLSECFGSWFPILYGGGLYSNSLGRVFVLTYINIKNMTPQSRNNL